MHRALRKEGAGSGSLLRGNKTESSWVIASADHLHAPGEPPNLEGFTQEEAGPGHGNGYPIILQSDKALGWGMTLPVPSLY